MGATRSLLAAVDKLTARPSASGQAAERSAARRGDPRDGRARPAAPRVIRSRAAVKPMTWTRRRSSGGRGTVLVFRDAAPSGSRPLRGGRQPGADRARGLKRRPVAAAPGAAGPAASGAEPDRGSHLSPAAGSTRVPPRVQRPGLALTGYTDYIRYGRVQIIGGSEVGYLRKLARARAPRDPAQAVPLPHHLLRRDQGPRAARRSCCRAAEARGIPVLTTPLESTPFIKLLSAFLEERLATRLHLHSVLLDVFGLGVLILGESGIGKSECALDLIDRGHRLVADDVVEIKRMGDAPGGGRRPT